MQFQQWKCSRHSPPDAKTDVVIPLQRIIGVLNDPCSREGNSTWLVIHFFSITRMSLWVTHLDTAVPTVESRYKPMSHVAFYCFHQQRHNPQFRVPSWSRLPKSQNKTLPTCCWSRDLTVFCCDVNVVAEVKIILFYYLCNYTLPHCRLTQYGRGHA
jgi:hypothetical protein